MAVTADSVIIELEARTGSFNSSVAGASGTFDRSMSQIERSASRAEVVVARSAGQIANSQRNLGRQIADVGTQLASGSSPFLILAQQAPQFADALADGQGRAARFASFFAGPWGAALLAGASVIGVMVGKLFDLDKAHDSAKQAADAHAEAERILDGVLQGTVETGERARIKSIQLAQAHAYEARAALNAARSQLALARARAEADRKNAQGGRNANLGLGYVADRSEERVAATQNLVDQTQILLNASELRLRNLLTADGSAQAALKKRADDKSDKAGAAAQRRAEAAARARSGRPSARHASRSRHRTALPAAGRS